MDFGMKWLKTSKDLFVDGISVILLRELIQIFSTQSRLLGTLNQHFLLFSHCFNSIKETKREILILATFSFVVCKCFQFGQVKILSFG